ncbi:MAG: hypothetical protein KAT58_10020 [candidate division Zixibacteria bacterium]|nr:hypothetical protein [candidate division Zixibacteria bacterium]
MDREYIEKHLAAYLDGELPETELQEFARELARYPDLLAEVESWKKLDALARQAQVEMPAEGYFDNLAERIDARIRKSAAPQKRSFLSWLLKPSPRMLAITGTIAVVILVAIIGREMYHSTSEKMFQPPVYPLQPDKSAALKHADTPGKKETGAGQEMTPPAAQSHRQDIPDKDLAALVESEQELSVAPKAAVRESIVIVPPEPLSPPAAVEIIEPLSELKVRGGRASEIPVTKPRDKKAAAVTVEMQSEQFIEPQAVPLSATNLTADDIVIRQEKGTPDLKRLNMRLSGVFADAVTRPYSEAEYDSVIKFYESQDSEAASAMTALQAYRRALDFRAIEYVEIARRKIEYYLRRADASDRNIMQGLLTELAKWQAMLHDKDSTTNPSP